jgi:hypothetical protein
MNIYKIKKPISKEKILKVRARNWLGLVDTGKKEHLKALQVRKLTNKRNK